MKAIRLILAWLLSLLLALLTVSMVMLGNWLPAVALLAALALVVPPVVALMQRRLGGRPRSWLRVGLVLALLGVFGYSLVATKVTSIYKSPEIRARFMELYDQKMREWPVPYEDIYLDTRYGKVHVVASGDKQAPPMLLLHASAVSSWSWKYNAAALSAHHRIFAIDLIGDAGKSEFANLDNIMRNGRDQAELYAQIADQLGVGKAVIVGASEGGFIGSNYALHFPDRVDKLVLLGPMGYAGATQSALCITFAQMFPLKPVQRWTFDWAFGDNAEIRQDFREWFLLIMNGYNPAKVPPWPLSSEQRRSLKVPVMMVLGSRDHLVGDPEAARALVSDIPDIRVEVVQAGHLMAVERDEAAAVVREECVRFSLHEGPRLPADFAGEHLRGNRRATARAIAAGRQQQAQGKTPQEGPSWLRQAQWPHG
jgi:pimeloyl-ACP methyl ester carboxylesterase